MNKRLDVVSKVLMSNDISSEGGKLKPQSEYQQLAATILVASDMAMLTPEMVKTAIINAGYEPAEHMESFMNIIKELHSVEIEPKFWLKDMQTAWAKGHENGFWDSRTTDKEKPEAVDAAPIQKVLFTEEDIRTAVTQGYVSGWDNGVLSKLSSPSDSSGEPFLLGAQHEEANNPYSPKAEG